jgi:glutathione S-transferase
MLHSDVHPVNTQPGSENKYTVPVILHVPSNKYIIESALIAEFLESTYPNPPVPLTSELGRKVESTGRSVVGAVFRTSMMPREIGILSPRAQEYFRRTREASLGHPLEDLLINEDETWNAASDKICAFGELMQTNKADGPFVLGAKPSYTDFFIAGSLQSARVIDEGVFRRLTKYPGYKEIYEACLPCMEKDD